MTVEVLKPGLLTTFQDGGRPGFAQLGIGRAGAFDVPAMRIANALCGNPPGACVLEATLAGPTLRFRSAAWIALTGASIEGRCGADRLPAWAPVFVAADTILQLGAARAGCRSYLAVHGGFDVEPVLGSRSTDTHAGLGPLRGRALRTGDRLAIAALDVRRPAPGGLGWSLDPRPWSAAAATEPLRLLPGRHLDQLTAGSRNGLFSESFQVHPHSDRVGVRLAGRQLEWTHPIEMASEGCVPGLLQLPPSGQPIIFGPEGPTSGGYPRVGQVAAVDMARVAQWRPGDRVRFRPCTFDEAIEALRARERALQAIERRVHQRLQTEFRPPFRKTDPTRLDPS